MSKSKPDAPTRAAIEARTNGCKHSKLPNGAFQLIASDCADCLAGIIRRTLAHDEAVALAKKVERLALNYSGGMADDCKCRGEIHQTCAVLHLALTYLRAVGEKESDDQTNP